MTVKNEPVIMLSARVYNALKTISHVIKLKKINRENLLDFVVVFKKFLFNIILLE